MNAITFVEHIRHRLIVSCQALPDEPLHGSEIMARMALAALQGGAAAIRANSPDDIRAIRQAVSLPLIGLYKDGDEGVYITPTQAHAEAIMDAGADVVALDATDRPRPNNEQLTDIIRAIHARGKLVLADVSTLAESKAAESAGADFAAPTLSGYTPYSPQQSEPDFDLLAAMVQELSIPVIAEGRIRTPADARRALDCGAVAVVVGSAITRPRTITASFVTGMRSEDGTTNNLS